MNLNSVEGLTKLLNELNCVIDNKIKKVKLDENIKKVDTLSFFECKNVFDGISDRLFESKKGQSCIAKYIKLIKENKDLRDMFTLYENFITPFNILDTKLFVTESCGYANDINKQNYKNGTKALRRLIKTSLKECSISDEDFNNILNEKKEINDSITFVLENKKTAKNLHLYTENLSNIINYIDKNKEPLNESVKEEHSFKDLKGVFENDLELWENAAIEKIVLCNISNGDKEKIFEEYKEKCLTLISETLEDEDITVETKSHLSTMKNQLQEKKYKEETINNDILKLAQLENTLLN